MSNLHISDIYYVALYIIIVVFFTYNYLISINIKTGQVTYITYFKTLFPYCLKSDWLSCLFLFI